MSRARKRKEDMNGSSFGVVSAGVGAERSAGERSEPQRSGATVPAGALPASRPDPEVVARPKRRSYTAEYKLHILQEAEVAAATPGAVGTLLRREGLYSSLLAYWRRERAHGIREALTPQKREKWRRCWVLRFRTKIRRRSLDGRGHRTSHRGRHPRRLSCPVRTPWVLLPGSTGSLGSDAHHAAAFTGTRPGPGGTHGGSGPSPWRTLSGSLAGRGLRDLAR